MPTVFGDHVVMEARAREVARGIEPIELGPSDERVLDLDALGTTQPYARRGVGDVGAGDARPGRTAHDQDAVAELAGQRVAAADDRVALVLAGAAEHGVGGIFEEHADPVVGEQVALYHRARGVARGIQARRASCHRPSLPMMSTLRAPLR